MSILFILSNSYVNGMDSILSFFIRQDFQDLLDFFNYNFPEESFKIQSPAAKEWPSYF